MNIQTPVKTIKHGKVLNGKSNEVTIAFEPLLQALGISKDDKIWAQVIDHDSTNVMFRLLTGDQTFPLRGRRAFFDEQADRTVDVLRLSPTKSSGSRRLDLAHSVHIPNFDYEGSTGLFEWDGEFDMITLRVRSAVEAKPESVTERATYLPLSDATECTYTSLDGKCRFTGVHAIPKLFLPDNIRERIGGDSHRCRFTYEVTDNKLVIAPRLYRGKDVEQLPNSTVELASPSALHLNGIDVDSGRYYSFTYHQHTATIWSITIDLS
jgi:hypothetical protein